MSESPPNLTRTNWQARADRFFEFKYLPLLFALSFLFSLGSVPLFDLDEGAFSSATMEMLKRGDFLTTYMGGELRFDKPILIYWLQAASVSLFGLNEFALRLPSALCATGWMLAIFYFVKQFFDVSRANTAVILMASSLVVSVIGRAATADALLNVLLCLSLLDAYRFFIATDQHKTNPRVIAWRTYLWVGLGVLAKGPVAIVIPMASMSLYAVFTRQGLAWRKLIINPIGWVICTAIFLPWYLAEYALQGQAFIDGFLLKHNVARFTNTLEGHGGHWYYYLPVSLLVFMPASGLYLNLWLRARQLWLSPFDIWCCCWFGVVLVLFSFSKTQLPHYLLYGATPVFMLMAKYRDQLRTPWLLLLPAGVFLAVFLGLPEIAKHLINTSHDLKLVATLRDSLANFDGAYRAELAVALLAVVVVSLCVRLHLWQRQLLVCVLCSAVWIHKILPTVAAIVQQPVVQAAQFAKNLDATIVMFHQDMPSFSVYLNRVVEIREPRIGEVLFTALNELHYYPNATILFAKGSVVLAKIGPPPNPETLPPTTTPSPNP